VAAVTGPRPIRVVVDRLVLHGVAHADAAAVQRALAAELRSALAGAEPGGGDRESVRLDVAAAADPGALGRSAGKALAGTLAGKGPAR
jgi:hypothetical protein